MTTIDRDFWAPPGEADLRARQAGPPPGERPDTRERGVRRTWTPVDLEAVLEGRYQPPQPTVGARDDGVGLFYPGRVHSVSSESEGGKTWLALAGALHELDAGNAVIYLDFEDDEGGIVGRLLALGADRDDIRDRFMYLRPEDSIDTLDNRADLAQVLGDMKPTLAVLDGVTEAMSLHGLEMKDNTDVARFGQVLPRWLSDRGPAVVALDHVVKAADRRGRYAIGGVHKLNGLNGAAYLLQNRAPFGIGVTGHSSVLIAKDRPGQLRRHALPATGGLHRFADLTLASQSEKAAALKIAPPAAGIEATLSADRMAMIAAALREHGALPKRRIATMVGGKRDATIAALNHLISDGYVTKETPHELARPYPEAEEAQ